MTGVEVTSMIGKSQGETEIPLDSVEWVLRAGGSLCCGPRSLSKTNAMAAWPDIHLREQCRDTVHDD